MSGYTITMQRSPTITEGEVRLHWACVYRMLLDIARERATADSSPASVSPSAVRDARTEAQDATKYSTMSAEKQTAWQILAPMLALAARQKNWCIYITLHTLLKRWEDQE